jgi:hypothetical protein
MNSDPRLAGPLSAIGTPIADSAQRFAASGPFHQSVGIACLGAIALAFVGETAAALGTVALSRWSPVALAVFAGVAGVGLLLLVIGWRGARGPRNAVMALTSVATPGLLAAGVWCIWGPLAFHNPLAHLLGVPFLIGFAVRFVLATKGIPGDARRMVNRQIQQTRVDMRPANGRR